MGRVVELLGVGTMLTFIACCVASAALQFLAWTRHKREDAPIRLGALWKPEGSFDPVGMRQITLARQLLLIAGVAYVSYGVVMLVAQRVG